MERARICLTGPVLVEQRCRLCSYLPVPYRQEPPLPSDCFIWRLCPLMARKGTGRPAPLPDGAMGSARSAPARCVWACCQ